MAGQGVVTILHADIEGSTALTTRLGDEAARPIVLETLQTLRAGIGENGGREIDSVGDAYMATFDSTRSAIMAAVAVQQALAGRQLRVRMGLNVGEVLERDGHPFGAAVNAGARVMARARGGEVLVSELVRNLAGTVPGVDYRDRGRHRFKGWDEPWRIYALQFEGAPPPPHRAVPRRYLVAVAAALVGAAIAAAAVVLVTGGSGSSITAIPSNAVGLLDPRSGEIREVVPVGHAPGPLAFGAGSLWVANTGDATVSRVTTKGAHAVSLPGHPVALAFNGDLWVATLERQLVRIDPRYDTISSTRRLPSTPAGIAVGGGAVWLSVGAQFAGSSATTLLRIPLAGGRAREIELPRGATGPLAWGANRLWVAGYGGVTPVAGRGIPGAAVQLLRTPTALVVSGGDVWAIAGDVQRLGASSQTVTASIHTLGQPVALAVNDANAWIADSSGGALTSIDTRSGALRRLHVGGSPDGLALSPMGLWVAVR